MESAEQLLPVDLVSILASSGPLRLLSERSCFRSFLGPSSWLTGQLTPQVVLAVGPFAILVPEVPVVLSAEVVVVMVGPGLWLQVAVVPGFGAAGGSQVSVAWFTCSLVAIAA